MAKKTFNIKSTLAVPPKQFSVDDIESAVKQIHDAKTAQAEPVTAPAQVAEGASKQTTKTPAKAPQIPPPTAAGKSREVTEAPAPVKKVRLSVDIHPATHKKLKIKAIEHDSDIMHYVETLIERDLGLA